MGREFRVVFATDFHGSEVCFRKVFNLAPRARADLIVLGGDLCGKALVPLVRRNGAYAGEFMGEPFEAQTESELTEVEKRIRFNGFYPLRCEPDELDAITADPVHREEVFRREMVLTVERWIGIGEEKLAGTDVPCVSIPGNDDDWAIDAALERSERIRNCDGRLIDCGEAQVLGFGASNATPWRSPRELREEQIEQRLRAIGADDDPARPLIANIHVPPYRSTLDNAPRLDDELRVLRRGGIPVFEPVGSRAVRAFVEDVQPLVSLHGHVHESPGVAKIGRCLAINPGSDYASGVLRAAVITLDLRKHAVKGHQFVSG